MRKKLTILLTLVFIGFVGLGTYDLRSNAVELELEQHQLEDHRLELKKVRLEKQTLETRFDQAIEEGKTTEKEMRQLEKEKLRLEEKTRELEQQLQAKKAEEERKRTAIANAQISQRASAAPQTTITGNKETWLTASGIPEKHWWAVDYIVSKESGWDPCAYNPSKSNCHLTAAQVNETQYHNVACGLGQSLPCGKWGSNWTDPVGQLKSMHQYVNKYGGWAGAVNYWKANGHY